MFYLFILVSFFSQLILSTGDVQVSVIMLMHTFMKSDKKQVYTQTVIDSW